MNFGSLVVQPNHVLRNKSIQNKRDADCMTVRATRSLVEINSVSKEHDASIFRTLIIQGKIYGEKQRKVVRE